MMPVVQLPIELDEKRAWEAARVVPDPEVPCVTVEDLGILRSIVIVDGIAITKVTPTYSGCPAVAHIEFAIEAALLEAGFTPKIVREMSPAWTTDWISQAGRDKLCAYGIAPPVKSSSSKLSLFGETTVSCPLCSSDKTKKISEFGSTACKAQYQCLTCAEPFDYFKCI